MSSTINYPKGINILSNVNIDNFIAIIDSGSVQFVYNDYEGNSTLLETLKEGDLFSNSSFNIKDEEITGTALQDTQITYIEYDEITNRDLIKTDFYIMFIKNLIKVLNDELKDKTDRIEILTKRTTRDKLLEYFKIISNKKGSKSFLLPMSLTDLARYLSVDRAAMSRELKNLKEEGFIELEKKKIRITY